MVQARINEEGEVTYEAEEFPLYYPGSAPFKDGTAPSGAAGAIAKVTVPVNNYPQILYGLRIRNAYTIPGATLLANPGILGLLKEYDGEQLVSVDMAQQNVTAEPIHQDTLTGARGTNWHPFPVPYLWRGGNQVRLQFTRLVAYPSVLDGQVETPIFPTVYVTLVCGVLVSDVFPAAGPPSTGAMGSAARRG